ncbi:sulfur carrier protein ThiS [Sphaerotilaceae bacterium SBD11-9]
MNISLNGHVHATRAHTLDGLLAEAGFDARQAFACALNTVFVPRAQWPQQPLRDGDRVDVVAPVTGG